MDVRLPSYSWDTHVHCFDPQRYPFRPTRAYTHGPAPLEELIQDKLTDHVVLVQASIEGGHAGLVAHLSRIRSEYPQILARGTICMDEKRTKLENSSVDALHQLGIRSCRIHGIYGGKKSDLASLQEQFLFVSRSYAVRTHGWSISAPLPLHTWAALKQFLLHDREMATVTIIADHNACATPGHIGSSEFTTFLQLLQCGRVYVKISALYRRSPDDICSMQTIIQSFADTAPYSLLWGSDWPHVNPANKAGDTQIDAPKLGI